MNVCQCDGGRAGAQKIHQLRAGHAEAERVALPLRERGDAGERQPGKIELVHRAAAAS